MFFVLLKQNRMNKAKTIKCKECGRGFRQFNSLVLWCSSLCGFKFSQKKLDIKKNRERIDKKNKTLNERLKLMSPSLYVEKYVQPVFNEVARLIDKGLPCIARGVFIKMDGGHYRSVANNTTIRLNLHNIHRQGVYSNREKRGDEQYYMDGLINEYGRDYFDFIHYKINQTPILQLSTIEYMAVKKAISAIRNDLKKQDKSYSLTERVELRNALNMKIGIYPIEFCEFSINQLK